MRNRLPLATTGAVYLRFSISKVYIIFGIKRKAVEIPVRAVEERLLIKLYEMEDGICHTYPKQMSLCLSKAFNTNRPFEERREI